MSWEITQKCREHLHDFTRFSYIHESPLAEIIAAGFSHEDVIDCSLGTNPFGCSPLVISNLQSRDWKEVHKYPDPSYQDLTDALVAFWSNTVSLSNDQILIGAGASGLIEKILKATIAPGRAVFGYAPQFTEFATEVFAQGGDYRWFALQESKFHQFNVSEFLQTLTPSYNLVYIDNPNNPTGQIIPLEDIERILHKARKFGLPVMIDEAYGDFTAQENSSLSLIPDFENLITVRSFSKGSGLANFRVGYAVSQKPLMSYLRKVDLPFPVSSTASHVALLSLQDEQFVLESRKRIELEKRKLIASCPNFYFAATNNEIPIMVIGVNNQDIDLAGLLRKKAILSESGADFYNLGPNYVRLRIPPSTDELILRLQSLGSL